MRRTPPMHDLLERILAMVSGEERPRPILVVGKIGSGKTSTGMQLLSLLRQADIRAGGFLAPRIVQEGETIGYSLVDIATGKTFPLAGLKPGGIPIGRYFLSEEGLAVAGRAIDRAIDDAQVAFVDEVGRLELRGAGHAPAVRRLLKSPILPILLIRDELADEAEETFGFEEPIRFPAVEAPGGNAPEPERTRMFWRIVDSIPHPHLVTIDQRGFPDSRPMRLIERSGRTLWFATSRASRKIAQIESNPHVTVLFVDSVRFNHASICGRAAIIDDPDRRHALWRDDWRDDWPAGPDDEDFVLLRIEGVCGTYLHGTTGESGSLDLA